MSENDAIEINLRAGGGFLASFTKP